MTSKVKHRSFACCFCMSMLLVRAVVLDCPWRLHLLGFFFKQMWKGVCLLEDTYCSYALYLSLHSAFSWMLFHSFLCTCMYHVTYTTLHEVINDFINLLWCILASYSVLTLRRCITLIITSTVVEGWVCMIASHYIFKIVKIIGAFVYVILKKIFQIKLVYFVYKAIIFPVVLYGCGVRSGVVVKALRYKPAGRGFNSRWCQDFSPWHNPASRTMALGWTQPLTEMSTRCVSCQQECSWG